MDCANMDHDPHFNLGRFLGLATVKITYGKPISVRDFRALADKVEQARADHAKGWGCQAPPTTEAENGGKPHA